MFGMDVLTQPQIDAFVLDFPNFRALGNGGAQSVDFGSGKVRKMWFNFAPQIFRGGGTHEHPYIGDRIFQVHRVVWQFRENRPREVEKSMVGKDKKHGQNIIV